MAILKNTIMSGKIGNCRCTRYGDSTILSEITTVKNPQTEAQMRQRLGLNNILQTYKKVKDAVSDTFEGCMDGRKVYAAFRSLNMKQTKVWLSSRDSMFAEQFIVAPYVVSNGSLEPVGYGFVDGKIVSDIYIGSLNIGSDTTVKDLSMEILSSGNDGWKDGDKLKVIILSQSLIPHGSEHLSHVSLVSQTIEIGHDDHHLNSGSIKWVNQDGRLGISFDDVDSKVIGAAIIHISRKGKKQLVSPQVLALSNTALLDAYTSDEAFSHAFDANKD